jgi:hypothetical protein
LKDRRLIVEELPWAIGKHQLTKPYVLKAIRSAAGKSLLNHSD